MDAESPQPSQAYLQLRNHVLNLDPAEVGLAPSTTAPHVWGVLMEMGYTVGTATLVSLADGTTSLYYSTGGGMLGSGDYTPVAEASKALVAQAEQNLPDMLSAGEIPLPEAGQVRFVLLTYSGILTVQASESTLADGSHPLAPLFKLAHATLTQLRRLVDKNRK